MTPPTAIKPTSKRVNPPLRNAKIGWRGFRERRPLLGICVALAGSSASAGLLGSAEKPRWEEPKVGSVC